jgi:hypothetical protein
MKPYAASTSGEDEDSRNTHLHTPAYVSVRQHASAYVSIRQHASACVSASLKIVAKKKKTAQWLQAQTYHQRGSYKHRLGLWRHRGERM